MNGFFNIKNNLCPFCKTQLEYSYVHCPDNAFIPCLECKQCHYYFYSTDDYNLLRNIASSCHKKLNQHVLVYKEPILNSINKSQKKKSKQHNKIKVQNSQKQAKNNKKNLSSVGVKKYKIIRVIHKDCEFYKDKYCIYLNKDCNINLISCPKNINLSQNNNHIINNTPKEKEAPKLLTSPKHNLKPNITTIVLNDNRKCIYNNHSIQDVTAILKISTPQKGIIDKIVNIAYCNTCDLYFMLKKEYETIKKQGAILCEIIDYTHKSKHNKSTYISSNESRIHQLGYNVIKGNNYTDTQRQAILAHIIENTNISKHEIESCIIRPMKQHMNQQNYADAVACWNKDLEFIRHYKKGDMPEVIIGKIIVSRRI